jgi:para-nitrobenzyl esterase
VITGGNHDEWRVFVAGQYDFSGHPLVTMTDYDNATVALWGFSLEFLYPFASYPSGGVALGANGTDGIYACPERNSVRLLSTHVPTYAYEFNDENAPFFFQPFATFPLGAYHSAELQYLFNGDFYGLGVAPLSPPQEQLSETMISYWTTFAANGDPNSAGQPVWSPYSLVTDQFQSLVPPTPMAEPSFSFDADHKCSAFWGG